MGGYTLYALGAFTVASFAQRYFGFISVGSTLISSIFPNVALVHAGCSATMFVLDAVSSKIKGEKPEPFTRVALTAGMIGLATAGLSQLPGVGFLRRGTHITFSVISLPQFLSSGRDIILTFQGHYQKTMLYGLLNAEKEVFHAKKSELPLNTSPPSMG